MLRNISLEKISQTDHPKLNLIIEYFGQYFGIMIGVCVFLASGVEIFGFGTFGAYAFSAAMTLLTSMLIWYQLTKILTLLQEGGSESLDLESVF